MFCSRHQVFVVDLIDSVELFGAGITKTTDDGLEDFNQYVGHSRVPEIRHLIKENSSMHYLDCLNSKVEFYEVELIT